MRSVSGKFGVGAAIADGLAAMGNRPVILLLAFAAVAVGVAAQATYVAAGGDVGSLAEPGPAILVATLLGIPIRALVSGTTIPLVVDPAVSTRDAYARAAERWAILAGAAAVAVLPVAPAGWFFRAAGVELGWAGNVLSAVGWWVGVRLSFVVVIAAVERRPPGATIAEAWRITHGRWLRTATLGVLAAGLLGLVTGTIVGMAEIPVPGWAWIAIFVGFTTVVDVFYAAAYRRLVEAPAVVPPLVAETAAPSPT